MRQIYAYDNPGYYEQYEEVTARLYRRLMDYQTILEDEYQLEDPPRGIIWTSKDIATNVFSDVPVPAYTSRDVIFMTPDVSEWQSVMYAQLEERSRPDLEKYYQAFDEDNVLIILAHELTHHIELFPDDFDDNDSGIWFEEGMCEYLPRRILLNDEAFEREMKHYEELVELFKSKYGSRSLEEFGAASYQANMASIMFDYWRSLLAVKFIVEDKYHGDIEKAFAVYNEWYDRHRDVTFSEYLGEELN
jgi:hypothetical protein